MIPFFSAPVSAAEGKKEQLVFHLSKFTNDIHAAFMAIKLAGLTVKKGADVVLFVDLDGVRIADKRQPQDMRWGQNPNGIDTYYKEFVENGGKVIVCPHCAKAAGLTESDLREGAVIGEEETLAELLLKADKIMDY